MTSYILRRVHYAMTAVMAYNEARGVPDEKPPDQDADYVDLITDILHLARYQGYDEDGQDILDTAKAQFQGEVRDNQLEREGT